MKALVFLNFSLTSFVQVLALNGSKNSSFFEFLKTLCIITFSCLKGSRFSLLFEFCQCFYISISLCLSHSLVYHVISRLSLVSTLVIDAVSSIFWCILYAVICLQTAHCTLVFLMKFCNCSQLILSILYFFCFLRLLSNLVLKIIKKEITNCRVVFLFYVYFRAIVIFSKKPILKEKNSMQAFRIRKPAIEWTVRRNGKIFLLNYKICLFKI